MIGNAANFLLIILVSLISVLANSLAKTGLKKIGIESLRPDYLLKNIFNIVFQPLILLAFFLLAVGALIWFRVLTQEPLSRGYPIFVGFTLVFLVLSSYFFLGEPLTAARILGMVLILAGTFTVFLI
jgi:multidrug transporter EmrE-like cation transporter